VKRLLTLLSTKRNTSYRIRCVKSAIPLPLREGDQLSVYIAAAMPSVVSVSTSKQRQSEDFSNVHIQKAATRFTSSEKADRLNYFA
jgi:hypothetical protein